MESSPPQEEMILISPSPRPSDASSPHKERKRQITPSPESSLSKNLLVFVCPTGPIQPQPLFTSIFATDLFPGGEAVIESRRPLRSLQHGHRESTSQPVLGHEDTLPLSRQIVLPFDLHKTPSEFFEAKNHDILVNVFPGVQILDFDERALVYHFDQLPNKPWPKKVAGVPCYLTDDPTDHGPIIPIQRKSRSRIAVSNNLDLRDNEAAVGLVFDLVRDFFASTEISITEILFWGHVIIIVLDDYSDKDEVLDMVPRSVAQCNCFYLFESEMDRPRKLSALRHKPASLAQVDDSQYDVLRPGVMLSSGKHLKEGWDMPSSSGVLVKDRFGNQYMTVAAHGFPGPSKEKDGKIVFEIVFDGKVHHPHATSKSVGSLMMDLAHTDVALVQLDEGVSFVNEPFENTVDQAPPFKLGNFVRAAETRIGDGVFLDSPFSGFLEGTRGPHSTLRVPSDGPSQPEQLWIRCQWDYMGQNANQVLADGIRGTAIWNENRQVLGFFRYAPKSGVLRDWCLSVAADHLLDKGYTIV